VAQEIRARSPEATVVFVGSSRGLEARVVPQHGYPLYGLAVRGLLGMSRLKQLAALGLVPVALLQAFVILVRVRPDFVLGVGGYASGPVVLAAWLMRLPAAVAEQNSVPGMTNRVLAKLVRRVFTGFEDHTGAFPAHKVAVTGNPVRREIATLEREESSGERLAVFVFGGSQGARALNRLLIESLAELAPLAARLEITHATGPREFEEVRRAYRDAGWEAEVHDFIDDMPAHYARADLVVSRAGATAVAEITAAGLASILVPFPYPTHYHQTLNARYLAERGAAVWLPQAEATPGRLRELIEGFLNDRERLRKMGQAARALARPEAARAIVDGCLELCGRESA